MQKFYPEDLIPHPKNDYFFDPMDGQKWKEFLESVKTSGVIEPPVITADKIIVSGHQRIRACKELGIEEIYCEVRRYDSEDKVLKDLIETNIRQRGNINSSELKMGRIIKELERIYGTKQGRGGDTSSNPQVADCKSQGQVAEELGMSVDKLNRLKKLAELPEEYQEMLLSGNISTNTAVSVVTKLTEEEQMQLLRNLPAAAKLTQVQVQAEVDKIKGTYVEQINSANELLIEAQKKQLPPDEDYEQVAAERNELKEKCREVYENFRESQSANSVLEREKKELEDSLKDQIRRNNKLEPVKKEVVKEIVEVIPEKYLKMEEELKKANEKIKSLQNPPSDFDDGQTMRIVEGNFTPEQVAQDEAQGLSENISDLLQLTAELIGNEELCCIMPIQYRELILHQGTDLIKNLNTIFTYFKKEDKKQCKTA
jgi:ParB family chromosome partitioning protein